MASNILPTLIEKARQGQLSLSEMQMLMDNPATMNTFRRFRRSDLLPFTFKIRGQPYSLEMYPQFRPMFDVAYVPQVLYMCGRQIGKSSNFSRSEILDCLQIPHFQILYIAPLQAQTHYYSATYLREAINTSPAARYLQEVDVPEMDAGPIMRQIGHQSFANGASIKLTYAKTSSDRARGIFADRADFDEIQDHLVDNIDVISQSLSQSAWGIRRFAGTAKTIDNTIEYLWQDSSQAEWAMKCEGCNHWNIPNIEGGIWEMVQSEGPCCVKCGKLLNVRNGLFVPAHPERHHMFAGFHMPQIVIPAITENPKKWSALLLKFMRQPPAVTQQELFGISCSTGARIITENDIKEHSTLPPMQQMQKKEWLKQYIYTIGGVDWGVAEQTSFTVHTVIGVTRDGKVHVLWARRFAGFDPDEVLQQIAKTHRYYNCSLICADYGVGFDKNVMLAHRFGLPMVQMMYCAQNQLLNYNPSLGQPRWMVDKVTSLEYLFLAIKYGRIAFPPHEEFFVYAQDLLSPYEAIVETKGIETRKFLRNPNRPDDFAHALNFAFLGAFRLLGMSMLEGVPVHKMGADITATGIPEGDNLNPLELLRSLTGGGNG
jgi:hypothetical protein